MKEYTWRGPPLNLKPPVVPPGTNTEFVAQVKPGASVKIVGGNEEDGALVAFLPAPYLWKLPREMWEFVHDEGDGGEEAVPTSSESPTSSEPPPSGFGGWDGTTLSPELLLKVLQHPNAVQVVTALVETRGDEAKAAVMPLLDPLMSALVPAEQLPAVKMALKMFIK